MKRKPSQSQDAHPKKIDWHDIHHRLESVRIAVEREWAPGPEKAKEILKIRAHLLAQSPVEDAAADHRLEVPMGEVTTDRIAILDAIKLLSDRKIVVHETVGG